MFPLLSFRMQISLMSSESVSNEPDLWLWFIQVVDVHIKLVSLASWGCLQWQLLSFARQCESPSMTWFLILWLNRSILESGYVALIIFNNVICKSSFTSWQSILVLEPMKDLCHSSQQISSIPPQYIPICKELVEGIIWI